MKTLISSFLSLGLLFTPAVSFAALQANLSIPNVTYATGVDFQLDVEFDSTQTLDNATSILTIISGSSTSIRSASFQAEGNPFLSESNWVKLTPYQNDPFSSDSEVTASFVTSGKIIGSKRVIPLKLNFGSPGTYVIGYTLKTSDGKVLSSTAAPITITGPKVLGVTSAQYRTLSMGSRGNDVTDLQNKLTALGIYKGPITGFYGRLTTAAVKNFQSQNNIVQAGGIATAFTQQIIFEQ